MSFENEIEYVIPRPPADALLDAQDLPQGAADEPNGRYSDRSVTTSTATLPSRGKVLLGKPADALMEAKAEPVSPISALSKSMFDDRMEISDRPPPRRWLLKRGSQGVLPLGKAGVLAAGGGVGKTTALVQLALAIATGTEWLDTFKVTSKGDVCILLGEEDREEVVRRFYRAASLLSMNSEDRTEATKHIFALPLAGKSVAFTEKGEFGKEPIQTQHLAALRTELLKPEREWRLVIIDPMSRFASSDAETDNAAATRFVQAVESLVDVPGNPTVLVAHHSSKMSVKDGEPNIRGSSAILDGFRWAATLEAVRTDKARGVRLRSAKSNYSMPFEDVYLVFSNEDVSHGTLKRAPDEEAEALKAAKTALPEAMESKIKALVKAEVQKLLKDGGKTNRGNAYKLMELEDA